MSISYQKLFSKMQEKGIKKIDLRTKYKINPKTVDSLVNNRSVTVDTIMQLCEILDCQPGDLIEYIKEQLHRIKQEDRAIKPCPLFYCSAGPCRNGFLQRVKGHRSSTKGRGIFPESWTKNAIPGLARSAQLRSAILFPVADIKISGAFVPKIGGFAAVFAGDKIAPPDCLP